jgi:hypothetical protein
VLGTSVGNNDGCILGIRDGCKEIAVDGAIDMLGRNDGDVDIIGDGAVLGVDE